MRSRPNSRLTGGLLIGLAAFGLQAGCQRDDDEPSASPSITFKTDSGYVFQDDTVGTEDTLLVGVSFTSGDDPIRTVKVLAEYDGGVASTTDSFPVSSSLFEVQKTIITRAIPGREEWTFWAQENDGDIYRRSLTFTVE